MPFTLYRKPMIGVLSGIGMLGLALGMKNVSGFADLSRPLFIIGLMVAFISLIWGYLRWRRKRLWWIHRQLRWAFIRATLIPFILVLALTALLIFILGWFHTIQMTRMFIESLTAFVERSGLVCVSRDGTWTCGNCQNLPPIVTEKTLTRHLIPLETLPPPCMECASTSPPKDALFAILVPALSSNQNAYHFGYITHSMLKSISERFQTPVTRIQIYHPSLRNLSPNPNRPVTVYEEPGLITSDFDYVVPYPMTSIQSFQDSGENSEQSFPEVLFFHFDLKNVFKNLIAAPHSTGRLTLALSIGFVILAIITTFIAGLLVFHGFMTSRRIGNTINTVEQAMNRLAAGDFPIHVPTKRKDQLGHLAHRVEQTSAAIARLIDEKIEHERLEKEIEIARSVQRRLFPAQLPSWPGLDIAVRLLPALRLSGDYYDFFQREDLFGIVVADVVGKGLPASLLMANVHAVLHFAHHYLKKPQDVIHLFQTVNFHLLEHTEPNQYVSMIYTAFRTNPARFMMASAGHPPAVFCDPDGTCKKLNSTGAILGVLPDAQWTYIEHPFPPGSCLVLCSDGILEALNEREAEYGIDRVCRQIRRAIPTAKSAWDIVNSIIMDVTTWSGKETFRDDVLIMAIYHSGNR